MTRSRRHSSRSSTVHADTHERAGHARPAAVAPAQTPPVPPQQPSFSATQPQPSLDRIGSILKREREQAGFDIIPIAEYLRIRPDFLHALENSQYHALPADAYVVGFLRSYANYLGLDGQAAIEHYRREMAGRRRAPSLSMPTPISGGRAPTVAILIGAVLAVLVIYGAWYALSSHDRAIVNIQPPLPIVPSTVNAIAPPPSVPPAPAPVASPFVAPVAAPPPTEVAPHEPAPHENTAAGIVLPATPESATEAPPQPPESLSSSAIKPEAPQAEATTPPAVLPAHGIVLRADSESWVLIADRRGNTVFDKILKPGQTYTVPEGANGYTLTTGNGSGLAILVDGRAMPRLAPDDRIVRGVPLDAEKLKDREPR